MIGLTFYFHIIFKPWWFIHRCEHCTTFTFHWLFFSILISNTLMRQTKEDLKFAMKKMGIF